MQKRMRISHPLVLLIVACSLVAVYLSFSVDFSSPSLVASSATSVKRKVDRIESADMNRIGRIESEIGRIESELRKLAETGPLSSRKPDQTPKLQLSRAVQMMQAPSTAVSQTSKQVDITQQALQLHPPQRPALKSTLSPATLLPVASANNIAGNSSLIKPVVTVEAKSAALRVKTALEIADDPTNTATLGTGGSAGIAMPRDGDFQLENTMEPLDECAASNSSSAYTWDWLRTSSQRYGKLSKMECVCGCTQQERAANHTRIECGFHPILDKARSCRFERLFFYSDESIKFAQQHTSKVRPRPLFVAICKLTKIHKRDFTQPSFWSALKMFGVNFDHLTEGRLARIDPEWNPTPNQKGEMLVPKLLRHLAGSPNHVWEPAGTENVMFRRVQLPPEMAFSNVALLESGDCWAHGGRGANPWHCLGSILNWHILGSLLGSSWNDTALFLLAGMDEYWSARQNGVTAYGSLARVVIEKYHDDDHNTMKSLKSGSDVHVALRGMVPIALTGVPSGASPMWSPEKAYSLLGDCSTKHQEKAVGGCNVRSEVFASLRTRVLKQLVRSASSDATFPVYDALDHFSPQVKLVLPTHLQSESSDPRAVLNELLASDLKAWHSLGTRKWQVRILQKLALVIRRSPHGSIEPKHPQCGRCIKNIDKVAQVVANHGLAVLFVHFTGSVPDQLQLWLWASARVVVGMHGGAWGNALFMGGGQGAVEILTGAKHLTDQMQARTFVVPSGAKIATTFWSGSDGLGYDVPLDSLRIALTSVLSSDADAAAANSCMSHQGAADSAVPTIVPSKKQDMLKAKVLKAGLTVQH